MGGEKFAGSRDLQLIQSSRTLSMPKLLALGFSQTLSTVTYETISHYQCQLPRQPPKSLNKYCDMLEI